MCWISRASLVTGTYASRHLQLEPPLLNMFTTHPWNQTLFPLMKQQGGYYTGIVGKWHAPQPPEYMPMTFDYSNFYFGSHWEERDGKTVHVTELNRLDSLKFLRERPRDKTFFLKVSFFATHAWDGHYPSYEPQHETKAAYYNNVTISTPKTATDQHWKDLPFFFREGNEARNRWRRRFEPDYYQDNIKDLYRMATEVDSAVGDIIEELKQQGVYDNTMLIFTTDNGNLHGEHGLAEKWYPFEESIRVPLVIQDPRMPRHVQGTRIDKLTLNIDLTPTILGAANIKPSYFMQGRDIAELYLGTSLSRQEPLPWREEYFYEYNRGDPITAEGHDGKFWIDASFALVTKEWKYIYWPQHDYEQLFHRSLDPYDEWDLLNRSTVQTNNETYIRMKQRYNRAKELVQSGKRCC
jgi:arylsulfatase